MNLKFPGLFFLTFLVLIAFEKPSSAQQNDSFSDNVNTDSTLRADTVRADSIRPASGALRSELISSASDSINTDFATNVIELYGQARVKYEDFELDAEYIRVDQKNKTLFARGMRNPRNGRYSGRPIFKQGNEAPITTDSLVFNYETKKGKSFGVYTEAEGGYLQAGQFKRNEWGEGHFVNGVYSTCSLPHPHEHFGVVISRGIATEKQIVTGPAYLQIEGVPLPLGLPFGFFPKPDKRSGGLLFPTFGEDIRGFFMRDLGYYFGISDYWDLAARGTLYSKGSYELTTAARYRKNYKYDGGFNLRFASTKTGIEGTPSYRRPSKDFNITWNHTQNPLANPGSTFSASVNAGTGTYFQNTGAQGTYNPVELARNSLASSISYTKVFGDGLFNFATSFTHRQDIERQDVFLELPAFSLNMSTISPFDTKKRVGEQKWYQRLTVGYSMQGRNSIDTKEYLLFRPESLEDLKNGIQHTIPISLSLNVFRYFQFSSSVQYGERWYLQTVRKRYEPDPSGFSLVSRTVQGFSRAYEYSLNSGLSTKVYGMLNFKRGNLMALRHVMTPSVSFNYRPDFGDERFGYFRRAERDTARFTSTRYSIYENAIFGSPTEGRVAGIGFSIDNTIEAKVRTSHDSTRNSQNIPILQSFSVSGNYNFAAPEFKLSTIGISGRTALFKQKMGINFYGTLDPYKIDELGRRIDRLTINDGLLARLTSFGLSTDFSLNSTAFKSRNDNLNQMDAVRQNLTPQQQADLNAISRDPNAFVDFSIPWNLSASYSFNYSKNGRVASISNTLNFYGDFNLTPKWKIQYNSGYDFQANKISLTQFSIYRDLHCWDLSVRWSPFGTYKFYSVDLRVKASILQDLKLSKRRDFYNNF